MGSSLTSYSFQIQDSEYNLFTGGVPLIENGPLRNDSAEGLIYDAANDLFFGDNTTSARSQVTLGDITLTTSVPLPPGIVLMLAECIGLALQSRRAHAV